MSPAAVDTASSLTDAGIKANNAPANGASKATTSSSLAALDASILTSTFTQTPRYVPAPNSAEVWAQNHCTDHMITCQWYADGGWQAPALVPYGPFSIMPCAQVLHYATECFEGMKVYRGNDGQLRLFRPDRNTARMLNSAARIALPAFEPAELEKLIVRLCAVDGPKWLPAHQKAGFLYIRPTMVANGEGIGVMRPKQALLYIFLCLFPSFDEPGGSLGPTPAHPSQVVIENSNGNGNGNGDENGNGTPAPMPAKQQKKAGLRLLASENDVVRAWPGGFGYAKVGANYGPSMVATGEAQARGYDQILWLFGAQDWVTEAGASNFFAVWRGKGGGSGKPQLVTAPLHDKIILEGVTRASVLDLARERLAGELEVVERPFTMQELVEAADDGRLLECFSSGTAFFISAVGHIHFRGRDLDVPMSEGASGRYALLLKTWLKEILLGDVQHPWGVVVHET